MPETTGPITALVYAEARILARQRLWAHLREVAELAGRGEIPAARMAIDDAMHDLDDIAGLLSEMESTDE